MFKAPHSEYLVPFDGSFSVKDAPTSDGRKSHNKKKLKQHLSDLDILQKALYAHDRHSIPSTSVKEDASSAGRSLGMGHLDSGAGPLEQPAVVGKHALRHSEVGHPSVLR